MSANMYFERQTGAVVVSCTVQLLRRTLQYLQEAACPVQLNPLIPEKT